MPVKVLIVDDSGFFRQRIGDILSGDARLEVVGMATNGREAVELVKRLRPDVVTMDVEMPQLNGIDAVRIIMRDNPTNVLMLSSLTHEGAQVTLQALEAGAADYLTKDIRAWVDKSGSMQRELVDKIVALGRNKRFLRSNAFADDAKSAQASRVHTFNNQSVRSAATAQANATATAQTSPSAFQERVKARLANAGLESGANASAPVPRKGRAHFPEHCKLVVIGSSTGGPAALQKILLELPANFPYPILLVQHMPKAFTSVFAARLNQQCQIAVKEAEDGDKLLPGRALLAPGGSQMILEARQSDRVRVLPGDERLTYRPSVDVSYAAAAKVFGNKVLGIILTGMGADGADGAKLLKRAGAIMWAQNEASCTIYGMPQAVVKAGLADDVLDLDEIGPLLKNRGRSGS